MADQATLSDPKDTTGAMSDSLFVLIKDFFLHLNPIVRAGAGFVALTCFDWAWTMSQNGEFLPAIIVTALAVVFALIALYGWTGIDERPSFTKVVKWVVGLTSMLWGVY